MFDSATCPFRPPLAFFAGFSLGASPSTILGLLDELIYEVVQRPEEAGSPGMSGEPDGNGAEAQSSTPRAAAPSNGTEAPPQSGAPEEATAGPSSGPEPKKTDPEAAEVAESAQPVTQWEGQREEEAEYGTGPFGRPGTGESLCG